MFKILRTGVLLGLAFVFLTATDIGTASSARNGQPDSRRLKLALLPILDAFPFYVAREHGFFQAEGVDVQVVPVSSGLERDQLMQAGQVDGMLTEMTTTAMFNRQGARVKIVGVLREAYPNEPLFRVLAAPKSGLTKVRDLAGVSIGVSKNTVIEYVTDRVLTRSGLNQKEIVTDSVPSIPERYQLLLQGRLRAATLPDPLALSAIKAGAREIVSDADFPRYAVSVFSFSLESLQNQPDAVRRFLRAWDRAVSKINENPAALNPLLFKTLRVPKNVQQDFVLPRYPLSKVPDSGQWADVVRWMMEKKLLETPLPYEESVTRAFLPAR